ncbi:MAG: ABC transporter permease [Acidimicrobiia bacterium]|nr:ABC transporter permease [Acidimicrobiia bacterium]
MAAVTAGADRAAPSTRRAPAGQRVSTSWTFLGLLERDWVVMKREWVAVLARSAMQPLLFIVVFGWILQKLGTVNSDMGTFLIPGILAMSTMLSGMQAVMMPIAIDLGFQREIDDRILCPIRVDLIGVEKILFGAGQGMLAALFVLPLAALIVPNADLSAGRLWALIPMLIATSLMSASFGMFVGTLVPPRQLALVMSAVVTPLMFFGCTYYPWVALAQVSVVLKWLVVLNPLVYASEGMRAVLTPSVPHMPVWGIVVGTLASVAVLGWIGIRRFTTRALE